MSRTTEDRAWDLLIRIDSYFTLASVKAALILPADAVLLAATSAGVYQLRSSPGAAPMSSPVGWTLSVTLAASLVSVVFALLVSAAFLKKDDGQDAPKSLIFFGSIRTMDRSNFQRCFTQCDEVGFSEDVLQQLHLLSGALHDKYVLLNWSIVFCLIGYAGLVAAVCLMIWGA